MHGMQWLDSNLSVLLTVYVSEKSKKKGNEYGFLMYNLEIMHELSFDKWHLANLIRNISFVFFLLFAFHFIGWSQDLPDVFGDQRSDVINAQLRHKASLSYQRLTPPGTREEWEERRKELRTLIFEKSRARKFSGLDLDYRVTGQCEIDGGVVKTIYFQTRPGVYATANLYIPEGPGPFPAVITMMGHSTDGKLYDMYRSVGFELVRNGYVSLHIDPWGAGERTTTHGDFEYHGAQLGAALLNVGETLLGMQLTDNMRGVDLLCSLPFVDASKIGATGASGGGNQTMWLAAMDERVKACMPVVSVGTFESYIMSSNCVCEMLPDGLNIAEESEILGLIAPRAILICNAEKESNQAFLPGEMLRSLERAKPVFDFLDAGGKLQYQIGSTTHGYHPVYREYLIGWMDLHLLGKGDGSPRKTEEYLLPEKQAMMVFEPGTRPEEVMNTIQYCKWKREDIKRELAGKIFGNASEKRKQLRGVLKIPDHTILYKEYKYGPLNGWIRYALELSDGSLLPVLVKPPASGSGEFVLIGNTEGKASITSEWISRIEKEGKGICLVDFWGLGENSSESAKRLNGNHLPEFHTLSRALMWLGNTLQGVWVREMEIVVDWLMEEFESQGISILSNKDLGLASLFFTALNTDKIKSLTVEDVPVSYLFEEEIKEGFFTMGVHIPGFLEWGEVSTAVALSQTPILFINPRNLDGTLFEDENDFMRTLQELNTKWLTESKVEFR
ncbi:dienelactone hydrolase family protein [Membranihabitans maritimus]|uniref:dienelactone hydrolase family protein n=1 Tax=Membranihabitans maritimus TaxID=2904244 RepID=UPI001F246D2C|nr:acetylxylan esterase [Membranihabitans maritimus]